MDEMENTMIGRGRDAIEMIVDAGSFDENKIGTAACTRDGSVPVRMRQQRSGRD